MNKKVLGEKVDVIYCDELDNKQALTTIKAFVSSSKSNYKKEIIEEVMQALRLIENALDELENAKKSLNELQFLVKGETNE